MFSSEADIALDLVSEALSLSSRSGLPQILRRAARAVGAYGCVLWQEYGGGSDDPRLFVLGQWFEGGEVHPLYDVSLHDSATGLAISTDKPVNVPDRRSDPRVLRKHPHLDRMGIIPLAATPLTFPDGTRGALNAYRREERPFTDEDLATLARLARLLPALYQSLNDRVSVDIVKAMSQLRLVSSASNHPPRADKAPAAIKTICDIVSDKLEAIETSVFLEDKPGEYSLHVTTWDTANRFQQSYEGSDDALTSWVIQNRRPLRLFDLANMQQDERRITHEYGPLSYAHSEAIVTGAQAKLKISSRIDVPPISFMAAPILTGDKLVGVVRCVSALKGPCFFSERDVSLLQLVATELAGHYANWKEHQTREEESRSWERLVDGVSEMNQLVQSELGGASPSENQVFQHALEVLSEVIPGADPLDVRLVDEDGKQLSFAYVYGEAWRRVRPAGVDDPLGRTYALDETSEGTKVYRTGRSSIMNDVTSFPDYEPTFPEVRRQYIVPIAVRDERYGVLDIRGMGDYPFPLQGPRIAELFGQQLGLYYFLFNQLRRLAAAEEELRSNLEQQRRQFVDFEHQVRSPIVAGALRLSSLLSGQSAGSVPFRDLYPVRGLLRKADRVASNLRLFTAIARDELPTLNPTRLLANPLVQLLIEFARDTQALAEADRPEFHVVPASFAGLAHHVVMADWDLISQAVSNLFDNAAKYSYAKSRVTILGAVDGYTFSISVISRGIPISPEETTRVTERGYRGFRARASTGEGQGIGLFLCERIMTAHGGKVDVVPTADTTEIRLCFPVQEERRP